MRPSFFPRLVSGRFSIPHLIVLFCVFGLSLVSISFGQEDEKKAVEKQEQGTPESEGQHGAHQEGNHEHTNHLIDETSPYLLMHAHNPVDWYPWGEEALDKARDENKVIFLSVGYSSCHWCHVMERESFLDPEIAAYLNENYVCIKVDREERPDIDQIYMTSLQIFNSMNGIKRGGGWPLTVFMTPEAKPFFAGTYFPARDGDRAGARGFKTLIELIDGGWNAKRDGIKADAEKITELTKHELNGRRDKATGPIQQTWIDECLARLSKSFDPVHGGFGYNEGNPMRPKFPEASNLFFLLDVCENNPENAAAKTMLETTLDQMFQGGIYDHVGGGFHRYSVDRFWHIPHYEKMLYDNGQLLSVYARAWKLIPKEEYKQACEEIVRFQLREMTHEGGGFYSALDAESEGEEGKFYRWEKAEIENVLGAEDFAKYAPVYRINEAPNFEDEYYSPQLNQSLEQIAESWSSTVPEVQAQLHSWNEKLLAHRDQRVRPLLDDKILTSWNGLMIRGLADAGRIFENPEYIQAAAKAADFILEKSMSSDDGRLQRTFTAGQARLNAYLDDYAFMIDGLIGLYQADGQDRWLKKAIELQAIQDELFLDEAGGYYFTSSDHESLLARAKKPADGAIPSGNSISVNNLVFLAENGPDESSKAAYRDQAKRALERSSSLLGDFPNVAPRLLVPLRSFAEKE